MEDFEEDHVLSSNKGGLPEGLGLLNNPSVTRKTGRSIPQPKPQTLNDRIFSWLLYEQVIHYI